MTDAEILSNKTASSNMVEISCEGEIAYRRSHDSIIRSLSDIERIVALEAENEKLSECSDRNDRNNFDLLAEQDKRITSLDDFNQELRERNIGFSETIKELRRCIAELQKFQAEFTPIAAYLARECNTTDGDLLHRFKDWLANRYLEQQLKTADSFLRMSQVSGRFGQGAISESDAIRKRNKIFNELKQLRKQAKEGAE